MSDERGRFRKEYRNLAANEIQAVEAIKNTAEIMEAIFENMPGDPRCKALAITKLEETVMWAVKGVTE